MICPVCQKEITRKNHVTTLAFQHNEKTHKAFVESEYRKIDSLFEKGYCGSAIEKECYFGGQFIYPYLHRKYGRDRIMQNSKRTVSRKLAEVKLTIQGRQYREALKLRYGNGVEGEDFVVCNLCNKKMDQLSHHLRTEHNISFNSYRDRYPKAKNLSTYSMRKISDNMLVNNPMKDDLLKLKASKNRLKLGRCLYKQKVNLGHRVRSSWEERFAQILQKLEIDYLYEPETFILKMDWGTFTYTPDFYMTSLNFFVEIKGWMDKSSELKIRMFRKFYSDKSLVLIKQEEYELICNQFNESLHLEKGDSKLDYMREHLISILKYFNSSNSLSADNPQGSPSDPSETIRQVSEQSENDIVRTTQRCVEVDRNGLPVAEKL